MHFCTDCQYETKKSENFFRDLLTLRRQFNGLGHPGKIAHHRLGLHIAVIHAKGHKIKVLVNDRPLLETAIAMMCAMIASITNIK